MSIDELVLSAQAVLQAGGLKTDFLRNKDLAMYRLESLDRHIELVVRPTGWTLSYIHCATRKTARIRGSDASGLERTLSPLCQEVAFEPPEGALTGKYR